MSDTSIQWTDKTWNPVRGCKVISPGCRGCYAMKQAHRFSGAGKPYEGLTKLHPTLGPIWTGDARFVPTMLDQPLRWREPKRIFVNSMSDLFHEDVTDAQIAAVFGVMALAPWHTYQILTKRPSRMRQWFATAGGDLALDRCLDALVREAPFAMPRHVGELARKAYKIHGLDHEQDAPWPLPWVWLGVSVENQRFADERVLHLLETPAKVRFVSYEPAIGPVDFTSIDFLRQGPPDRMHPYDPVIRLDALRGHVRGPDDMLDARLSWCIVGGESGPRARPFELAWARSVVRQCREANVACFVKQLGAKPAVSPVGDGDAIFETMDLSDPKGGAIEDFPEDLRVREWPKGAC